jgi:hypothetical protein
METLQLLSAALGIAALAGINLYLTVLVTGLAIRFEWITLHQHYQQLEVLSHPAILTIAAVLYFLEFFADKIPWVDSLWDTLHTIIRPVGGTLLAIQVLGESNEVFDVAVAIVACGVAVTTHTVKAGTRLIANSSPEPVSNIVLSTAEDVAVLGGLWLLYTDPLISLVVLVLSVAGILWFAPRLLRGIRLKLWLIWRKLNGPASDRTAVLLPSRLPADADMIFSRANPEGRSIEWAVPAISGRVPGVSSGISGYLVALREDLPRVFFVAPRRFGSVMREIEFKGWKVSHEPAFLSENLVLYHPASKKKCLFLFDRPRGEVVARLAADLEERTNPVSAGETATPALAPAGPAPSA